MSARTKRIWSEVDIALNEESTTLTAQLHGLSCPACSSKKYAKNGKEKGNQRYRCSRCGKHFRSTTGNTIHHLHLKPKIQAYIDCMNEGLSLRKTAKKIDISLQTAFRWRHRFLKAMDKQSVQIQQKNKTISAFTLPFSAKGNRKTEHTRQKVTNILQVDVTGKTVVDVLGKHGKSVTKLIQSLRNNTTIVKSKSMPKGFNRETEKAFIPVKHIELEILLWLKTFRGVATKYLKNYWNWFMLIRQIQLRNSEQSQYMYNCF